MKKNTRIEMTEKPTACPACGHRPVADILFGMPAWSPELDKDLKSGKVTLGGCCVSDDDPEWQCSRCKQVVYRKKA